MSLNTVKRVFTAVRSVINLTMREYGIKGTNAFSGTFMPDKPDASPRQPIPNDILKVIQDRCQSTDDEMRWLVAMISDTGMRLAEAAGLSRADVHLDKAIPHINIRPHPWRRLKTSGSQRQIPLVGASHWAALRIKENAYSCYAFSRYTDDKQCRANAASNTLNKWMQANFREDIVVHGFRHALRDRLRTVQCPSEMIDQIGGWSSGKVGESYGEGYTVGGLNVYLSRLVLGIFVNQQAKN